jgi:hypothetical protein
MRSITSNVRRRLAGATIGAMRRCSRSAQAVGEIGLDVFQRAVECKDLTGDLFSQLSNVVGKTDTKKLSHSRAPTLALGAG